MPDHGSNATADERWSTVWPNLLRFVGPKSVRDEITNHTEAAIVTYIAEQHFQSMLHWNTVIQKLEQFPEEAKTPANNSNDNSSNSTTATATATTNDTNDTTTPSAMSDPPTATEMGHRAALDFLVSSKEYQNCLKKTKLAEALLREAKDNSTWKEVSREDNGIDGTWYREEKHLSSHSFRVVGTLKKVAVLDLACLLLELDMYNEWFPMCFRSKQVGVITRYERCAAFEISCPWPMSNREACLWGFAIDDLERTRRCYIVAENHMRKIEHVEVPAVPKGVVRLQVHQCGYILEAIDANTTRVTFVSNINPDMKLPEWLLNWANSKFCGVLMWQMHRSAKKAKEDPKSPYTERKQHDIYDDFKKRVAAMDFSKTVEELEKGCEAEFASVKPKSVPPLYQVAVGNSKAAASFSPSAVPDFA